jgi:hypothetical protein
MTFGDQLANDFVLNLTPYWTAPIRPYMSLLPPPPLNDRPRSVQTANEVGNDWDDVFETVYRMPSTGIYEPVFYTAEYYIRVFGRSSDRGLFAAGMSPMLDAVVAIMRHPQYGDKFAGLVAQYWPTTWALLQRGRHDPGNGHGVFRAVTDRPYWVSGLVISVADPARDSLLAEARRATATSLWEMYGFPGNIPGVESLEQKSETFKRDVAQADAVLGVISKVVSIAAALAGLGSIGGN